MELDNSKLNRLANYLFRLSRVSFVLHLLLIGILTVTLSVLSFYNSILASYPADFEIESISAFDFIGYCFFVPIAETLIFVVLPYRVYLSLSFFKRNPLLLVIISAIIFALLHIWLTSIIYIFPHFFITCAFWIFGYFVRAGRKKGPFWDIVIAHGLYNGLTLLMEFLM